jgi:hypothetical protein
MKALSAGAAQFSAKSVLEELQSARLTGAPITTPYLEIENALNFRATKRNQRYQEGAEKRRLKKLKSLKLQDVEALIDYRRFEHDLRQQ